MKKFNVILDVDPGVDDATCLIFILNDPRFKVHMISVADGNIPLKEAVKHTLYMLDLTNKNVPVIPGITLKKRTDKEAKDAQKRAQSMHGVTTIGGVPVPEKTKHKETKTDVAEAMYKIIKENPGKITIISCAPQTNINHLLEKHPDAAKLIKQFVYMGGSFGVPNYPDHISYNTGANPQAYNNVIHSGLKCVMVQSLIGRKFACFTEEQVNQIAKMGPCGKFLAQSFSIYWEKGYEEKFVANNDLCSYLYLTYPRKFKTQKVNICVNLTDKPGKLTKTPNKKSKIKLITHLNNKWFVKTMFQKIRNVKDFNF